MKSISKTLATVFGLGYLPLPGLIGALVGDVLFMYTGGFSLETRIVIVLVFILVGLFVATETEKILGEKDARPIIIDEVTGVLLGTLFFTPSALVFMLALTGFLFFDRTKLWPASRSQSLPRGWGVVCDDWIAGLYTGGAVYIFISFIMPLLLSWSL